MSNINLDKFRAFCISEAAEISELMADSFDAALTKYNQYNVGPSEEAFEGSLVTNSVDSNFLDHIANLKHLPSASI